MPRPMNRQERLARDLAETLTDTQETEVQPDTIAGWPDYDVYEWLAAWGFHWDGQQWVRV